MARAGRVAAGAVAAWLAALLVNRSLRRVAGSSMAPTLGPGDLLLVAPAAVRPPRVGDVVVAPDPRRPRRATVKRLAAASAGGLATLRGDNPAASTDSRTYGPVPVTSIRAVALARIWPRPRML